MIYINKVKNIKPIEERNTYPYNIPSIVNLNELGFRKSVTFITGENGSGKSTLVEAIAINAGFNPEGGSRNFNFRTQDSHSKLFNYLKLSWSSRNKDGFFLRAESYYNFASNMDALDAEPGGTPIKQYYGGKSLHEQSHGESFLALLVNRLYGNGLYIFDEPEAALSVSSQFKMLVRMKELADKNSQFIIATHSPVLMAYPDADIYVVSETGIDLIDYESTEQYRLTKYFVNNHRQFLSELGL
ncbi:MAG TPA: AAA family ATPase [Clostridiaceae bacterium]|jgi:predicted ATPase|nr:AAA family ATPase [Clostridiaceae bacterium]